MLAAVNSPVIVRVDDAQLITIVPSAPTPMAPILRSTPVIVVCAVKLAVAVELAPDATSIFPPAPLIVVVPAEQNKAIVHDASARTSPAV